MNTQIVPSPDGSPFDSIRRINEHGEEYWSTRELGPIMGYTRFENFMNPLKRAMTTASNQGFDVEVLFLRSQEKGFGRPAEDFELSRFAAYLVAMNGDPNKPEVAAAQAYFAIQTRVAETRPALDLNALDPRALALAILEESDRADAAEKRLAIVAPKAEAFQQFIESEGSLPMGAVANMFKVGRQTLFDWLKLAKIIQPDRRPYQEYAHWFEVKATTFERSSGMSGVSYSSKLLPCGVDPLYKLLVRRDYIKPESATA